MKSLRTRVNVCTHFYLYKNNLHCKLKALSNLILKNVWCSFNRKTSQNSLQKLCRISGTRLLQKVNKRPCSSLVFPEKGYTIFINKRVFKYVLVREKKHTRRGLVLYEALYVKNNFLQKSQQLKFILPFKTIQIVFLLTDKKRATKDFPFVLFFYYFAGLSHTIF